jgi:hypothetical protein
MMDLHGLDTLLSIGVGVGLAAAAGLRVFVPLLALSAAAKWGGFPIADRFTWLQSDLAFGILAVATVAEVAAYYIPVVDNVLDGLAAPFAVAAGIVLSAAVMTDLPPEVRWAAAIIAGGGTAGIVHGLTSITRLKSTALTAGLGNPVIATAELVGSVITSIVVIVLPVVAIAVVLTLLLVIRAIRRRRVRATGGATA